jgi:predicted transcriptional regulator
MPDLAELDPQHAASLLLAEHDSSWIAALTDELDRALSGRQLERIMRLWDLTRTDLGHLFGVSRQAVSKWIDAGVPSERIPQVADLAAITDLLAHYLKRDRIPAVVRRPAPNLEGASLLELVSKGRIADAVVLTRQMFTFADAQG